jgi:hypothetical protein
MEYDLNSGVQAAPLGIGHTLFASTMVLLVGYVAQDSVKRYKKARTWATFFMARLGVFSFIFQVLHLTSICLCLWSVAIASRIMWFMVPIGTVANLGLNLWRVRIFSYMLPAKLVKALEVKFMATILALIAFVSCIPLYIWIFAPDVYKSSQTIMHWANAGFTLWISIYTIADLIAAAVSLRKMFEVVMNGRERHSRECKALLITMILTDTYCVFDMCFLAAKSVFPYPRHLISPLFSLTMLHVTVTYLYMVSIVLYMTDRPNSIISVTQDEAPKQARASNDWDQPVSPSVKKSRTSETPATPKMTSNSNIPPGAGSKESSIVEEPQTQKEKEDFPKFQI